jgi:hypothetical protein
MNAKAYDADDPDYVAGSNNGDGAYHTIVYPDSWTHITDIIDASNSQALAWEYDDDITVDGILYKVARSTNKQFAGDYTYNVS